jgi:Ca2+-binding RTX toxin-like protein
MALTKLYGVNSSYNANDDLYSFSRLGGTFIIDGAGIDTIYTLGTSSDVTIDLRPGAQSYLTSKSTFITFPNQLTISHGSIIENVETGSGNDTIIGTYLENVINTGAGNDVIFAGDGADIINSGSGADQIDLSETIQARDTVKLNTPSNEVGFDTIYGFLQGITGDTLDVSSILNFTAEIFPLVILNNAPNANFSNGILRMVGTNLKTASDLSDAFSLGGGLEQLSIFAGTRALIVSAESQETGTNQCVFDVEAHEGEIAITKLAVLQGNALDIDQWHTDNFSFIA